MRFFFFDSFSEPIDVLVFVGEEIEVRLKIHVDYQDPFVVLRDSPEPDRGLAFVRVAVEVKEPEVKLQFRKALFQGEFKFA